ncbi:hypothetical protein G6F57_005087 [Rhizopus arrhizus]|uniref:Uncharacterized protein n=1 Tax=Rhizopus oryzae TaxID=64495 RepID=A0A9P7BPU0_RHIOR|nr:hypothetical protein G6F23_003852 [Rhizopus arrhizus]KAG1245113.1 hypothetical protein G6F68_015187 [Rhizopus microsporus]KAG1417853.1 hypothetical protein G6F58_005316 [Rhizopus delemar]KAG0765145.1 hypothetical protein G6F24_004650 [Rhizopus arrhizus]KAG0790042.1 hypothetical protein G6F22_006524 [Rhizopus arrhizus]
MWSLEMKYPWIGGRPSKEMHWASFEKHWGNPWRYFHWQMNHWFCWMAYVYFPRVHPLGHFGLSDPPAATFHAHSPSQDVISSLGQDQADRTRSLDLRVGPSITPQKSRDNLKDTNGRSSAQVNRSTSVNMLISRPSIFCIQ